MELKRFAAAAFTAAYPPGWSVEEREATFPEGKFPQVCFTGPEEPYEIGVAGSRLGPSFISPPKVLVTFGPALQQPLKQFSEETLHELRHAKPTGPTATTIDGNEAFELFCEFTFLQPGFPNPVHLARRLIHVNLHGQLVVISYTAHATQLLRFKKEAEAIINSIAFR